MNSTITSNTAKNFGKTGFFLGGVLNGLRERSSAQVQLESEYNTISLEYEKPVFQDEFAGQLPQTSYHPGRRVPTMSDRGPEVVENYIENPVLDASGQPVLETATRSFEGYGEPQVSWTENDIVNREMTGYTSSTTPDTVRVQTGTRYVSGCSSNVVGQILGDSPTTTCNGSGHYVPTFGSRTVGHTLEFRPQYDRTVVGQYEEPEVEFVSDTSLTAAFWKGALKGSVVGALMGVVAGVVYHVLSKEAAPE